MKSSDNIEFSKEAIVMDGWTVLVESNNRTNKHIGYEQCGWKHNCYIKVDEQCSWKYIEQIK